MNNEEYLQSVGIDRSRRDYREMLRILNSYGDNRWWLSDDPQTRAYYQTLEGSKSGRLLIDFDQLRQDTEALLGHPVSIIDFSASNARSLCQEVERAWASRTNEKQ